MPEDDTPDYVADGDEMHVDIEVLRSACEESRAALDHQLNKLNAIDDKALWSVRTAIVVLGLLLSAVSLADNTTFTNVPWIVKAPAIFGTTSLVTSIWAGLATYHVSVEEFGLGPLDRLAVLNGTFDERQWRRTLLASGYQDWLAHQTEFNDFNSILLLITHLLLGIGVTLVVIAGVLYILPV